MAKRPRREWTEGGAQMGPRVDLMETDFLNLLGVALLRLLHRPPTLQAVGGGVGEGRVCRPVPARFSLQTVEHGFPHQPSALGYSPSLRILAIGTRSGAVKLYPFLSPSSRSGMPWKGTGP